MDDPQIKHRKRFLAFWCVRVFTSDYEKWVSVAKKPRPSKAMLILWRKDIWEYFDKVGVMHTVGFRLLSPSDPLSCVRFTGPDRFPAPQKQEAAFRRCERLLSPLRLVPGCLHGGVRSNTCNIVY